MKIINFKKLMLARTTKVVLVIFFAALPLLSVLPASASVNASFSLTPATKTITAGDDLVLNLVMNTGGNSVLAWKTTITYSTTAFSSVSVQPDASSHFTLNPATDITSGGTIKLARYAKTASTSNTTLAKITLHSKGVGNTGVTLAHICNPTSDTTQCSAVTDVTGINLLSTLGNSNIAVAAVPVSGTAAKSTKKKSLVSRVSDTIANVISPSTEAATSTDNGLSISKGSIQITVLNKKNKALEGARVTLAGKTGITNGKGRVLLTDISPGEAKGTIVYKDKTQNISVYVEEGTTTYAPQQVSFTFNTGGSMLLPILLSIVALIVIAGLVDLVFISKGGFKDNVDRLFHHGSGGDQAPTGPVEATRHSPTKIHDRHSPMTPGLIVSPNTRGEEPDWKH